MTYLSRLWAWLKRDPNEWYLRRSGREAIRDEAERRRDPPPTGWILPSRNSMQRLRRLWGWLTRETGEWDASGRRRSAIRERAEKHRDPPFTWGPVGW
jgi:hypothetical protein